MFKKIKTMKFTGKWMEPGKEFHSEFRPKRQSMYSLICGCQLLSSNKQATITIEIKDRIKEWKQGGSPQKREIVQIIMYRWWWGGTGIGDHTGKQREQMGKGGNAAKTKGWLKGCIETYSN